jgi:SAM-dependent methyltransferase
VNRLDVAAWAQLVVQKPQLEDVRAVEAVDPQQRSGRGDRGSRRHQADKLGADHLCPTYFRFPLDTSDDLVERRRLVVLDVHAHLHQPRGRQLQSERPHPREASVALPHRTRNLTRRHNRAAEVDVEGDQRPPRTNEDRAGPLVEASRPVIGLELARREPPTELHRPPAAKERRPPAGRQLAVQEDGKIELGAHPLGQHPGGVASPRQILGQDRHHGHDVRRTDPRMRACVSTQIDPLTRAGDPGKQRLDELLRGADQCENRAVVILVGVDVEQPGPVAERFSEGVERCAVATFGEVRHRLERPSHGRSLGAVRTYYDRRAAEYDDWWLGRGLYAEKRRPGWDEERAHLEGWIAELPSGRTLDVACGTGFMTQHLRGEVVGLDQSDAMLDVAGEQVPGATFVQGDALELPFPDRSFDRVFASYFYCHLEREERRRFLAEARRVAPELVIVGSRLQDGEQPERWDKRILSDGTRWQVFKRVFVPEELARELDGRVLHESHYFVMAATP